MSDSLKKLLDFIDDLLDSTTRNGRDVSSVDEDPPLLLNRAKSEILRSKGFAKEVTNEELKRDRCWDEHKQTL